MLYTTAPPGASSAVPRSRRQPCRSRSAMIVRGRHLMNALRIIGLGLGVVCTASSVAAQDMPADYQQVLTTLVRQGDFKGNVLKVNVPRNDLSVTVAGVKTPTPFGFGGWAAI